MSHSHFSEETKAQGGSHSAQCAPAHLAKAPGAQPAGRGAAHGRLPSAPGGAAPWSSWRAPPRNWACRPPAPRTDTRDGVRLCARSSKPRAQGRLQRVPQTPLPDSAPGPASCLPPRLCPRLRPKPRPAPPFCPRPRPTPQTLPQTPPRVCPQWEGSGASWDRRTTPGTWRPCFFSNCEDTGRILIGNVLRGQEEGHGDGWRQAGKRD